MNYSFYCNLVQHGKNILVVCWRNYSWILDINIINIIF
jgi:hypothetical protein